jgi:peptide/nickel transport system permease protein
MSGSLYELDDYGENVVLQWRNLILPVVLGIDRWLSLVN